MASPGNGSPLGPAARLERDRRITEARDVEGLTWAAIGERFGVSERHAKRVYGNFLEGVREGAIADVDVQGAVFRVVRVHLAALTRLEELIANAEQSNQGVGVLRTASSVGLGLLEALARTGYLLDPRDEVIRRRVEAVERGLARDLIKAAEEAGLSGERIDRAIDSESSVIAARSGDRLAAGRAGRRVRGGEGEPRAA